MDFSNEKLLAHLPGPPPEGWIERTEAKFPGLKIQWETGDFRTPAGQSPDSVSDEAVWKDVTMLSCYMPPSPERMKGVRWVQLISAGSDLWLAHPSFLDPEVTFCNASGCHAVQIAEWVIGSWLSFNHHFGTYMDQQREHNWAMRRDKNVLDSSGCRIGILGYGSIGRCIARIAKALGMDVVVYTRRPRDTPESRRHTGYMPHNSGDVDGDLPSRWFSGDLDDFLRNNLDILVISVPLSNATRGLIGRDQLRIMGDANKTFLCNVARGPIVDSDALVEALQSGLIRGAAVDVADPEPLPKESPLWDAPNLFITPHISWMSTQLMLREVNLLEQNLERLRDGMPLLNIIAK